MAANSAHWLTGGADGLQGIRMWPLFGAFEFDLWGYTAYGYSLVALFVFFLAARRLVLASNLREAFTPPSDGPAPLDLGGRLGLHYQPVVAVPGVVWGEEVISRR